MKRYGNLIGRIVDPDNLKLAYVKACRAKPLSRDRLAFRSRLDVELESLAASLRDGSYRSGPYRFFTISDPKRRTISAAPFRDRVAQHAIMNVLDPVFERAQIHDSYACRTGKGTQKAVLRVFHHARSQRWFLKLDVRKYFDSISHDILKDQLARRIKDRGVLSAFSAIINSYETSPGRGVPIGNLTSQYFANHYLAGLDHAILERLRVPRYVRYMDDMVVLHQSKEALEDACGFIDTYARDELGLDLKPVVINRTASGVPFCGFLIKPLGIFLLDRTRRRYRAKQNALLDALGSGRISESEYADRALASASHLAIARSRAFRYTVFRQGFFRQGLFRHEPGDPQP